MHCGWRVVASRTSSSSTGCCQTWTGLRYCAVSGGRTRGFPCSYSPPVTRWNTGSTGCRRAPTTTSPSRSPLRRSCCGCADCCAVAVPTKRPKTEPYAYWVTSYWPRRRGTMKAGAFSDNTVQKYTGIRGNALTAAQKTKLLGIVEAFVGRAKADVATVKLAEVRKHLNDTYITWAVEPATTTPSTSACTARSYGGARLRGRGPRAVARARRHHRDRGNRADPPATNEPAARPTPQTWRHPALRTTGPRVPCPSSRPRRP